MFVGKKNKDKESLSYKNVIDDLPFFHKLVKYISHGILMTFSIISKQTW